MTIKRQEFYEGAALHVLIRNGHVRSIRYLSPFFLLNDKLSVLLKYCAKSRSPWSFTFTSSEQKLLQAEAAKLDTVIGLICGSDGVAVFNHESFASLTLPTNVPAHISCYRVHGEYYDISGPAGGLAKKISPSRWRKILDR